MDIYKIFKAIFPISTVHFHELESLQQSTIDRTFEAVQSDIEVF